MLDSEELRASPRSRGLPGLRGDRGPGRAGSPAQGAHRRPVRPGAYQGLRFGHRRRRPSAGQSPARLDGALLRRHGGRRVAGHRTAQGQLRPDIHAPGDHPGAPRDHPSRAGAGRHAVRRPALRRPRRTDGPGPHRVTDPRVEHVPGPAGDRASGQRARHRRTSGRTSGCAGARRPVRADRGCPIDPDPGAGGDPAVRRRDRAGAVVRCHRPGAQRGHRVPRRGRAGAQGGRHGRRLPRGGAARRHRAPRGDPRPGGARGHALLLPLPRQRYTRGHGDRGA